jgi:Holliday junction DNA helicase RuvA
MSTFYNLPATGERITLYTHLVVREDAHLLYGFGTEGERSAFRQLMKVNGIGAKIGLAVPFRIVGRGTGADDHAAGDGTAHQDPGIGKKTAERILLEMKDKLGANLTQAVGVNRAPPPSSDILNALVSLGYSDKEAVTAVKKLPDRRRSGRRHPPGPEASGKGMTSSSRQGFLRHVKMPPGLFRRGLNLWPPFFGAGVRVTRVSDDYREVDVTLKLGLLNRNYFGTQFGGVDVRDDRSVLRADDAPEPWRRLRRVGQGRRNPLPEALAAAMFTRNSGSPTQAIERARKATARGAKHEPTFHVAIVDDDGATVAEVDKTLYIAASATTRSRASARRGPKHRIRHAIESDELPRVIAGKAASPQEEAFERALRPRGSPNTSAGEDQGPARHIHRGDAQARRSARSRAAVRPARASARRRCRTSSRTSSA